MGLQREIWVNDIQETLWQENPFMTRISNHSEFVNYKTVHIPQAGADQGVVKNRTLLPALINQRVDTELTYNLNEYTINPFLVTNIEELQINYAKRQSILSTSMSKLSDVIANQSLYTWAPTGAAKIIRTTGTADANALAPGATGTRNAITLADIAKMRAVLDKDNVPQSGRILLLPSDMYNGQLLAINNIQSALIYGSAILPSGTVNRLFGFDIMIRPSSLVYDNSATPVLKAINDEGQVITPAATDNLAALAFHPNFLTHSVGDIKVFYDMDKPEYYGSLFSALVMHGASKMRLDQKGIVALVQQ
ncbi:MAG: phage capsid protein [Bacteroidia bacterium]